MIALICLAGSGDAYVLFRHGEHVEGRYFPHGDYQVKRWMIWLKRQHGERVAWRYISDRELADNMREAGLTEGDFVQINYGRQP